MTTALLPPLPRLVRLRHVPDDELVEHPLLDHGAGSTDRRHCVLHVGCGQHGPGRLHPMFSGPAWNEVRVDIDPTVEPDIVASLTDLGVVASGSVQAVWCSHSLEHLCAHEVGPALAEFRRVLASDGFALIRSPDLEAVLTVAAEEGLDHLVYRSPAGPVTALDMIYGHAPSIARDKPHMRHGTGFTVRRLGRVLEDAGFARVCVGRTSDFTVWGAAFGSDADHVRVLRALSGRGIHLASRSAH